ncbi:MAG: NepR family anti-sigma factor [Pseudomonadota bacterium]|nr:NepR family anti-sigma factor [Pseudomonadota bacterium]
MATARKSEESEKLQAKRAALLGHALREAYAEILAEPCPPRMLELLEQLRKKEIELRRKSK